MTEPQPDSTREPILKGIRVIELGHIVAGPFAGMILSGLGAEVIKIEHPDGGDSMRRPASIGLFYSLNWNKKSVQLNLRAEKDREVFYELIRDSDVLIENLGPGVVDKLGIGYQELSRINPALIYCAIKGFLPGPYAHRPLVDEMAQMMGGLAYMTGPPGQPMRAGASIADMTAAAFAAIGVLAALFRRKETGRGEHISAGIFETVALWVARYVIEHQLTGEVPEPMTVKNMALRMRWEVYDRFKTRDGKEVIIAFTSDKHWIGFCNTLGLASWKQDPRLATKENRLATRDWLLPLIQSVVTGYARDDLIQLLDRNGVPTAPVNTPADLVNDPQLIEARQLLTLDAEGRELRTPVLPIRIGSHAPPTTGHVPALGEHTEEIIKRYSNK
ncbi:MAG: CoA transferase [Deltaproteobacteria bacterium]|nr:CoA transferase [Deltaproteobacteria bacterium]